MKIKPVILLLISFSILVGVVGYLEARTIKVSKDYLITSNSIGKVKVGMAFSEFLKEYSKKNYVISDLGNSFDVYLGKDVILTIATTDNKKTVSDVQTTSNLFKTKEGISVGTSVSTLLKLYPKMEIMQDPEDFFEYFLPKNYHTKNSRVSMRLISNDGEPLGTDYQQQGDIFATTKVRYNGKVDSITIFKLK